MAQPAPVLERACFRSRAQSGRVELPFRRGFGDLWQQVNLMVLALWQNLMCLQSFVAAVQGHHPPVDAANRYGDRVRTDTQSLPVICLICIAAAAPRV